MQREPIDTQTSTNSQEQEAPTKESFVSNAHYFVEVFVITLCVVLFLTVFVMRHTVVDGSSMQGTLQDGQHLLISDLFYEAERGDIVVLQSSDIGIDTPIVKRIIALEGDRIKMENGVVYINGEALEEDYVLRGCHMGEILDFPELTVSQGHVFVMGDHRDNSLDSREFGEIDKRCILGRVYLRIYPFNQIGIPD